VIRHEGCSYERTPEPFAKHDEEELRDILMSHLNGHYHGLANGEAFRKRGKQIFASSLKIELPLSGNVNFGKVSRNF